jgi:hypothetical protein
MIKILQHTCGQLVTVEHFDIPVSSHQDRPDEISVYRIDGAEFRECPQCSQALTELSLSEPAPVPSIHDLPDFLDPFQADEFSTIHRCSSCWGVLIKRMRRDETSKRHYWLECEICKEKTPGYVSASYVEWRIQKSSLELYEARRALRDAVPWLKSGKTAQQLIKELGY